MGLGSEHTDKWDEHDSIKLIESKKYKVLWYFNIQTKHKKELNLVK